MLPEQSQEYDLSTARNGSKHMYCEGSEMGKVLETQRCVTEIRGNIAEISSTTEKGPRADQNFLNVDFQPQKVVSLSPL